MKTFTAFSWLMILCLLLSAASIYSQKDSTRHFYKPEWREKLTRKPANKKKWDDFEILSRNYVNHMVPDDKTLPLVFHILSNNSTSKVAEKDIYEQIAVLNEAFAGRMLGDKNDIYKDRNAGDTKIKFCLGTPQGKQEGIYNKVTGTSYNLDNLYIASDKKDGLEGANKEEYINVWILELDDQLGGEAILPDHGSSMDGIFIDPDFFGKKSDQKNYHSGKTLVHLMGRYLGLYPLWTDGNCADDGVADTPIHNAPNTKCYIGMHMSTCPGKEREMIGNFMDSNPDDCAYMFTTGQMARMHATLGEYGYRKNLLKGSKLCDPKNTEEEITAEVRNKIDQLDFTLMPNPATNTVEISYSSTENIGSRLIEVFNISGQKVYTIDIPSYGDYKGRVSIDISTWESGQYIVKVKDGREVKTKTLTTIK